MLNIAEDIPRVDGRIEGAFDARDGWIPVPVEPTTDQVRFFLGDPESGPLVWLFFGHPDAHKAEPSPETARQPHLHRTPTFRIALGEQPHQMLLNNAWYGPGEYFVLNANKRYSDPNGVRGFRTLLIFADRRGMHPAMKPTAGMASDALIAWNAKLFAPMGPGLGSLHVANDEAIGGAALAGREHVEIGAQARGSLKDQSAWARLSDGSRVAVVLMGDKTAGPAVIMSGNAPNAVESPASRCGGDMVRLITEGSCTIGGRSYPAGSFMAYAAGDPIEDVVHGPEGSTQLIVVGDRRAWAPVDERGAPVAFARIAEIAGVMAKAD